MAASTSLLIPLALQIPTGWHPDPSGQSAQEHRRGPGPPHEAKDGEGVVSVRGDRPAGVELAGRKFC